MILVQLLLKDVFMAAGAFPAVFSNCHLMQVYIKQDLCNPQKGPGENEIDSRFMRGFMLEYLCLRLLA